MRLYDIQEEILLANVALGYGFARTGDDDDAALEAQQRNELRHIEESDDE